MTSLLSDMRTVRPKGRTFRITQPHGLRLLYLGTPLGRGKRLSRVIFSNKTAFAIKTKPDFVINLKIARVCPFVNRLSATEHWTSYGQSGQKPVPPAQYIFSTCELFFHSVG